MTDTVDLYADADAFFEERRRKDTRKPQVLRLFGEEYELPLQTPVGYMLLEQRYREESSVDALQAVLTPVYGPSAIEDWGNQGMGAEDLTVVLAWTTANLSSPGSASLADAAEMVEKAEGKAQPNRAERRAASPGKKKTPAQKRATSGARS